MCNKAANMNLLESNFWEIVFGDLDNASAMCDKMLIKGNHRIVWPCSDYVHVL